MRVSINGRNLRFIQRIASLVAALIDLKLIGIIESSLKSFFFEVRVSNLYNFLNYFNKKSAFQGVLYMRVSIVVAVLHPLPKNFPIAIDKILVQLKCRTFTIANEMQDSLQVLLFWNKYYFSLHTF